MISEIDSERFFFDSLNGNQFYFNSYTSRPALLILLHSNSFLELSTYPYISAEDLSFGEILVSHSRTNFSLFKPVTQVNKHDSEHIGWNISRYRSGDSMVNFFRYSEIADLYKVLFKISE